QKEKDGFWWVVTEPKGKDDRFWVTVSLRTFPATFTEKEMRHELSMTSLAYILNVPARVAMSYPGLRGIVLEDVKLPRLDEVPVAAKLEKLFKEYQPPELKK